MNKKCFGKLIAALRKENFDPAVGKVWTQSILAEKTNLPIRTIQRIEQGELANIDDLTLLSLSKAFRLSTLERREFCLAAAGVSDFDIARPIDPSTAFHEVWSLFKKIRTPAVLHDQFYDLIGVNSAIIAFHNISREALLMHKEEHPGSNLLRYIFEPESPLRISLRGQWTHFVRRNILQFRHMSFRYRYTQRYQDLVNHLQQYKMFKDAWLATQGVEETAYSQLKGYDYQHPYFGYIQYMVTNTTTVTQLGNLYLSTIVPCNKEMEKVVERLSNDSPYVMSLTKWPNQE